MFPWFQLLILGIIWKAFEDFWKEQIGNAEDAIREKLRSLEGGEQLGTSPLVKVLAVDNVADTVTILVRGPIKLTEGITPFMRIEVVISRGEINLTGDGPPIRIKDWRTVIGDIAITDEAAEGSLGFGYDNGAWLGEGSLKVGVTPMRLGAAIYGGISDRGMILGLDAEFPPGGAIPLGPTGLALRGLGGDFAYNFVARLEKDGMPIASPTAFDYVTWARDRQSVDRWKAGPIDKTAVGIAVRTILCTIADQGYVYELNPIGFAFLTPGGAFILGGKGRLLRRQKLSVESYFVVDFASASLAFGSGVNIELESPPAGLVGFAITTLKGTGQLDVFFSFADPTAWFFDFGREDKPASLELLTDVPVVSILFPDKIEAYLRINHHRIAFGASLSMGGGFRLKDFLELSARLTASLHAYMGRDPLVIHGTLNVKGELDFKAFDKFEFHLTGDTTVLVYLPTPVLFRFELAYKLDLPWPLPDIEGKKGFGDEEIKAPAITAPLLAGSFTVGGGAPNNRKEPKITARHTVSERQWRPGADKLWPDIELVVPFSRRVTDNTKTVMGPVVSPTSAPDGYIITEELTKLEILDLVHNTLVPNVRAVWADGPGGSTALLHVLGADPFSWLTAQTTLIQLGVSTPARVRDVYFGVGPAESFAFPLRFDDMFVTPVNEPAKLVLDFQPNLATRVLRAKEVIFRFMSGGEEIAVDQVTLFLVGFQEIATGQANLDISFSEVGKIVGNVSLVAATFVFPTPQQGFAIQAQAGSEILIYSVRYREAAQNADVTWEKTRLKPGHYRITIEGKSTAAHPQSNQPSTPFPAAPQVDWRTTQEFEVIYPESLHPYIYHSTFGDNRRFSLDQHPWTTWTANTWDPALFGFGLPLYRQYHLVVRFLVPYLGGIFDHVPLKMRLAYDKGGEIVRAVAATPAPDGASAMLPQSQAWIAAMGGTVPPDEELVFPELLPKAGIARLTLFFNHPTGGEVPVEDWTGIVSVFNNFREHLAWSATCLTRYYDSNGRHEEPACPSLGKPFKKPLLEYILAPGIEPLINEKDLLEVSKPAALVSLLDGDIIAGPIVAYPPELTAAPLDWLLPTQLMAHLGGLDNSAGLRFGRFATDSGARFNSGGGDALRGIADLVPATTVEAVTDAEKRPYALWVRTQEPVDWRRATVSLSIRHVAPENGCPKSYAHRQPLELAVTVLPSPDGSSAFLVGSFAGVAVRLPHGEFTLTLQFDPNKAGLPPLRPSVLVGPGSELVMLRFLQPLGKTWPQPSDGLVIPHYFAEIAAKYLKIPPVFFIEAYQKTLSAAELEDRIRAHLSATAADALLRDAPDTAALESLEAPEAEGGKA